MAGRQPTLKPGQIGMPAVHERHVGGQRRLTAQTEFVYRNFDAVLKAPGAGWQDVVKVHAYLLGESLLAASQPVRNRFLPTGRVSTTSVVSRLVGINRGAPAPLGARRAACNGQ